MIHKEAPSDDLPRIPQMPLRENQMKEYKAITLQNKSKKQTKKERTYKQIQKHLKN